LDHFNVLCDEKAMKRQVLIVFDWKKLFDLLVLDRWNHRFLYVITFVWGSCFPFCTFIISAIQACYKQVEILDLLVEWWLIIEF
jgi:hypothetical protein